MGTRGPENEIPISRRRPPPPWIELPGEVTENILRRLGAEEILKSAEKVCTTWRKVCLDPAMWRVVHMKNRRGDDLDYDIMCCVAVARSQGQLIDLSITGFGGDGLIKYVACRSSHLRRLTLADLRNVSAFALTAAVKKLPKLEELHLTRITTLDAKDVETIGISCPLLNSFTYNEITAAIQKARFTDPEDPEEYELEEFGIALAVAKTMLNMHHLRLVGIEMKNEALEAILDGCPHLESLTLRDCYGLDLRGALSERSPNLTCLTLSPNVKRPTLISTFGISGDSLVQAVKILPHLVELHLTEMDWVSAQDVEAIGFSCPKLKSFSYNQRGCKIRCSKDPEDDDDDDDDDLIQLFIWGEHALAIGKSMPNLSHLQLFANKMKNKGLEAILDGCPHLESLDIRQCFGLDLGGDLGKRCHEKIKDLKLPSDSISDIVWLADESSGDYSYEDDESYDESSDVIIYGSDDEY